MVVARVLTETARSLSPSASKSALIMSRGVQLMGTPLRVAGQAILNAGKAVKDPVPRSVPSAALIVWFKRTEMEARVVLSPPFNTAMSGTPS